MTCCHNIFVATLKVNVTARSCSKLCLVHYFVILSPILKLFHRNVEFIINGYKQNLMIIKKLFEGPVGDYCIARNTIKCLLNKLYHLKLEVFLKNVALILLLLRCIILDIQKPIPYLEW